MEANRLGAVRARRTPGCRASRTSTPTGWPTRRSTASGPASPGTSASRTRRPTSRTPLVEEVESPSGSGRSRRRSPATAAGRRPAGRSPRWCWSGTAPPRYTAEKRFSGGLGEQQPRPHRRGPGPGARGRRLAGADRRGASTSSSPRPYAGPASRPRSSPSGSGVDLVEEPGFAEMEFGTWDGLTFAEVRDQRPGRDRGLARLARRRARRRRVVPRGREAGARPALQRVLETYAGKTVVVVSHVTPIKILVAHAVDAPLSALFRMELSTASVSVVSFFGEPSGDGDPRLDAALQRAAARRRPDARPAALVAAQSSLTTTSSWVPVLVGRPGLDRPAEVGQQGGEAPPACGRRGRPRAGRGPAGPWSPC